MMGCLLLAIGCQGSGPGDNDSADRTTLRLSAQDDGDLASCDASGVCQSLPNPRDCATLVIQIDNQSGRTCETCLDASDAVLFATCDSPSVACELITLPEPDCLLCAYVNGAIIYSTCVAPPDDDHCGDIICAACEPGTVPRKEPGQCCPSCEPVACPAVVCALPLCEEGFHVELLEGDCCPSCVPDKSACYSNRDCGEGELCTVNNPGCDAPCEAGNLECLSVCVGECVRPVE